MAKGMLGVCNAWALPVFMFLGFLCVLLAISAMSVRNALSFVAKGREGTNVVNSFTANYQIIFHYGLFETDIIQPNGQHTHYANWCDDDTYMGVETVNASGTIISQDVSHYTPCNLALNAQCKAAKAFIIFGFLASLASFCTLSYIESLEEEGRGFGVSPAQMATLAALCYLIVISCLAHRRNGEFYTDKFRGLRNNGTDCGYRGMAQTAEATADFDITNYEYDNGFFLVCGAFCGSILQAWFAGVMDVHARVDNDETIKAKIEDRAARDRQEAERRARQMEEEFSKLETRKAKRLSNDMSNAI